MKPRLLRNPGERQLRFAIAAFFLALAVPAAALLWRGFEQSRFEVFYQHRVLAEQLADRIEADVGRVVDVEEARPFADYGFLVLAGDTGTGYVQRSALSAWPVSAALPGAVGYFQVDSGGALTTPQVPPPGTDARAWGIGDGELAERVALAERLRAILNRPPVATAPQEDRADGLTALEEARPASPPATLSGNVFERLTDAYEAQSREDRYAADEFEASVALDLDRDLEQKVRAREALRKDAKQARAPRQQAARASRKEQVAVLEAPADAAPPPATEIALAAPAAGAVAAFDDANDQGARAKRDPEPAEKVSASGPALGSNAADALGAGAATVARGRSVDGALISRSGKLEADAAPAVEGFAQQTVKRDDDAPARAPRVRLFESEVDPLSFEVLDERHFLLFRNVWRAGERYIQGVVVAREPFLAALVGEAWQRSALSGTSELAIALPGALLERWTSAPAGRYTASAGGLRGELLYRARLPAPLSALELIFSVVELPPGPGVRLLAWLGVAFALVLSGGCYGLYRLGATQISLYRQQQDFVSAVSHELKTPLTSIRMYSEMLKAGWADEEKKQGYYTFIHDESERLSRLIANVLQLARLNRGAAPLELRPERVSALLDQVRSRVSSQAEAAGFALEVMLDHGVGDASVAVDVDAFTQVLINLVDNAIKFTPPDAARRIELGCRATRAGEVAFTVRDFGRGIERGQLKKIFQLFYRAENELTRETVGTGIGLALVHELVQRMHGRVDVLNREPGAEFVLSFPRCETDAA